MNDPDEDSSSPLYWFGVTTGVTIIIANLPILWIIWKENSQTFINQLIGIDCLLCLGMIPVVLNHSSVFQLPCSFITSYAFFASLLNRLLPVGIIIYRFIYVCRSSWVLTAHQRKVCQISLSLSILALPICLTIGSWIYREKYAYYLICTGQGDKFFDSTEKTDGFAWLLPIYNPFHLLTLFAFFSYAVLVPLGYTAIYKFRRQDSYDVAGLSERSRLIRRHRNIVTTKFNLLNWIF